MNSIYVERHVSSVRLLVWSVASILAAVELILSFVVAIITAGFRFLQQWYAIIYALCRVRFGDDFPLSISALPSGFSSPSFTVPGGEVYLYAL